MCLVQNSCGTNPIIKFLAFGFDVIHGIKQLVQYRLPKRQFGITNHKSAAIAAEELQLKD
jgi:hypothetical protein